ncbi:hypothetical protein BOTNAR_0023g00250 [Botryotinia narcissicola]|uniref:acylphosphatase n=1 Tax=Botryotinia narcissicola TaxID=278944 RepID=A0A4Z1J4M1_9HELO|nr:hypothetical protein BOTNAR_0023g00250 [Botryotinia narcissicola]
MDREEKLDKRIAFTVSGNVQGVNFRWFTQKKARALGVVGWVRNTDDGKVKGEAQGSASQIESLRADLKEGPSHANVTGYEDKELDFKEKGVAEERFEVTTVSFGVNGTIGRGGDDSFGGGGAAVLSDGSVLDQDIDSYATDAEVWLVLLNVFPGEGADRTELRDTDQYILVTSVAAEYPNTVVIFSTVRARIVNTCIDLKRLSSQNQNTLSIFLPKHSSIIIRPF